MAKAISTDPPMNFRFGVRLRDDEAWRGFQRIEVEPTNHPSGPGIVHLEKALEPELLELVNMRGKHCMRIGVFHISDEMCGDAPMHQITLNGVSPERAKMSKIILDAHGRDGRTVQSREWLRSRQESARSLQGPMQSHHNMVLVARVSIPYASMEIKAREVVTRANPNAGAAPGTVRM